jgi:RHS repeat-associated protein
MATTTYTFDPLGRKTSQTLNAGTTSEATTSFDYLATSSALADETTNRTITKSYQYAPTGQRLDQIVHNTDGSLTPTYYTYNPHTDVQAITNASGTTKATYGYTAYGADDASQDTGIDKTAGGGATSPTGTTEPYNPYRFNHDRIDPVTAAIDTGFRTYDPSISRFLTRDMYNGALADQNLTTDPYTGNPYAFAAGNPLTNIELDGHEPGSWCGDSDIEGKASQCTGALQQHQTYNPLAPRGPGNDSSSTLGDPNDYAISACAVHDNCGLMYDQNGNQQPGTYGQDQYNKYYHEYCATRGDWCDYLRKLSDKQGNDFIKGLIGYTDAVNCFGHGSISGCFFTALNIVGVAKGFKAFEAARGVDESAAITEATALACGQSFTPETKVVMADGSTKPLDDVKVGDKVEATDPATGKTSAQTVTKVWVNHDTDLMDVIIKAGGKTSVIHATQHHLFWDVTRHAWTDAQNLKPGDGLHTDNGGTIATVVSTTVVPGAADMWDLTIQTAHDFYIVAAAASVLVHNCGGIDLNYSQVRERITSHILGKHGAGTSSMGTKFAGNLGEDELFSGLLNRLDPSNATGLVDETGNHQHILNWPGAGANGEGRVEVWVDSSGNLGGMWPIN